MLDLGTLGGLNSFAFGINASGAITGNSFNGFGAQQAFLYMGSKMFDLGTLGGTFSTGIGINALAEITGQSTVNAADTVFHAFLYSKGTMTNLGTLGGSYSFGQAINRWTQVVGDSVSFAKFPFGFLFSGGVMYNLNDLIVDTSAGGWILNTATGINDTGQIVGGGFNFRTGETHALLLTPVTEAEIPVTANSGDGFHSQSTTAQTGTFAFTFDAEPSIKPLDAVVGLALGLPSSYSHLAAVVRFNPSGRIDARNGGAYAAASTIPYTAGLVYRFRMVVNVATHQYSIYVTPPGGAELTVGTNFAFRTEQNRVTSLNTWTVQVNGTPAHAAVTVGNVSVTPVLEPGNPVTAGSGNGFHNQAIAAKTGTFTTTFDARPSVRPLDGVIALARGAPTSYSRLAAIVRFNPADNIDARNGGAYAAASTIPYVANATYRFRLVVNVATHRYSIYVTPPGGTERTVGTNFAFRAEQNTVTSLNDWTVQVNGTPAGAALTVTNFTTTP